jgi:hypothetical protein
MGSVPSLIDRNIGRETACPKSAPLFLLQMDKNCKTVYAIHENGMRSNGQAPIWIGWPEGVYRKAAKMNPVAAIRRRSTVP